LTTLRPRTLEDLRHVEEAAWLWDVARGRIVWANGAGVAFFGCENVFDLVDRPFDLREPGVMALQDIAAALTPGQSRAAQLAFPGSGPHHEVAASCSLHLLADGRQGVLAVAEAVRKPLPPLSDDLSRSALQHLPVAILVSDGEGHIISGNDAARAMIDLAAARNLADLILPPEHAAELLSRLGQAGMTSAVENVACVLGQREVRLTLSRLPSAAATLISIVLEDVTDRRALERSLHATPAAAAKPAPQDAFAMLAKSLQDTIEAQSSLAIKPAPKTEQRRSVADPMTAAAPAVEAASKPEPATRRAQGKHFVPHPVRQSFERTGEAILIGRDDDVHFATSKAAQLLGYTDVESLLADDGLWQHLKATTLPARATSLPTATGGTIDLSVSSGSVPWINGRADKFTLRSNEAKHTPNLHIVTSSTTAAEAPVPVVATPKPEAPAPAVADDAQAIAAHEMKAMLDVASDGIIALDDEGVILSFSAGAEAIFGMSRDEVKGRPLADLLSADSRKPLRDYIAGLGGPGLASVFNDGREFTAIVKQGGEVPLFVTLGKLQSPHSKASFCAVVRDITQWKRTEQELREAKEAAEQASRQKSDFLAGISHEIRTPLNAILGFSEVMRLERFGEMKNDKYRAYANDIHASGTHLLALVNDLLDLSKVEAGKMELDFTAVNVADAVDHVLRLLGEEASRANVVVRKSLGTGLPRVVADLRALRQVLLNLLSNAIKYTDAGGQVIISTMMDETGELVLRVKDNGIGMTAAQIQDALRPFTRVQSAGRERQGTGLGLPLSKALVEANRAQFTMASEPGQGTLAEIRFPATRVLAE